MTKGYKCVRLMKMIMFCYTTLFKDFLVGKLLSKWEGPYVIEEVYHSSAIKINNFEGTNLKVVNGQRIKHYVSGNPINLKPILLKP